jgi:hypothetical protein
VTVASGSTSDTTGSFVPDAQAPGPAPPFGYLRATTDPPVAAMITVDGQPRNTWGIDWLKVPPGPHEVCFGPTINATAPSSCTTVTVTDGATAEVTGSYAPKGFLRVVTDPPVAATIFVDGSPSNAFGLWASKPPGSYDVCFGSVEGFLAPPCQDGVGVAADDTTTVTGVYEPVP